MLTGFAVYTEAKFLYQIHIWIPQIWASNIFSSNNKWYKGVIRYINVNAVGFIILKAWNICLVVVIIIYIARKWKCFCILIYIINIHKAFQSGTVFYTSVWNWTYFFKCVIAFVFAALLRVKICQKAFFIKHIAHNLTFRYIKRIKRILTIVFFTVNFNSVSGIRINKFIIIGINFELHLFWKRPLLACLYKNTDLFIQFWDYIRFWSANFTIGIQVKCTALSKNYFIYWAAGFIIFRHMIQYVVNFYSFVCNSCNLAHYCICRNNCPHYFFVFICSGKVIINWNYIPF